MNIKFSPPDITENEIALVVDALKSGWITTGPKTKLFEKKIAEYCGTLRAVALNSATAGMELLLKILGVKAGDEVITTAYTYTASASIIDHVGAKIVLCDVAENSYEMDYDKLESLINDKTKVIIPVDIAGKICDLNRIFQIVMEKKKIFKPNSDMQNLFGRIIVLSDCAHSFGAEINGVKAGNIADFSCFSFHAVKNLTTAEGGAITWRALEGLDDELLYKQFMLWSLHGQSKDALAKTQVGMWEYDIELLGNKCNMTDVASGIGLAQIERYSQILAKRKKIITSFNEGFSQLPIQVVKHYGENYASSGHLYLTRLEGIGVKERNEIIVKMAEKGISTNVHYKPLPMFTAYKNLGFGIKNFPNAFAQYQNEITLPLHTLLTEGEVNYIINTFSKIVKEYL